MCSPRVDSTIYAKRIHSILFRALSDFDYRECGSFRWDLLELCSIGFLFLFLIEFQRLVLVPHE
jgi:hypothetical protein